MFTEIPWRKTLNALADTLRLRRKRPAQIVASAGQQATGWRQIHQADEEHLTRSPSKPRRHA